MQNKRTPVEKMLDTLTAQDAELAALRAELAAMTARAEQAERELRVLADVFTKRESGGDA